jgi:hypothetical protein
VYVAGEQADDREKATFAEMYGWAWRREQTDGRCAPPPSTHFLSDLS